MVIIEVSYLNIKILKPGNIIDVKNNIYKHDGIENYTIGQRKQYVSINKPLYV